MMPVETCSLWRMLEFLEKKDPDKIRELREEIDPVFFGEALSSDNPAVCYALHLERLAECRRLAVQYQEVSKSMDTRRTELQKKASGLDERFFEEFFESLDGYFDYKKSAIARDIRRTQAWDTGFGMWPQRAGNSLTPQAKKPTSYWPASTDGTLSFPWAGAARPSWRTSSRTIWAPNGSRMNSATFSTDALKTTKNVG